LREAFETRADASSVLNHLQELYQAHRRAGVER
jgi:multiple sugar transport system substrate-binding protein